MKNSYQRQLQDLITELLKNDNVELLEYQSVLTMIYTLIEDGKTEQLDYVLRVNFPIYYTSPAPLVIYEN